MLGGMQGLMLNLMLGRRNAGRRQSHAIKGGSCGGCLAGGVKVHHHGAKRSAKDVFSIEQFARGDTGGKRFELSGDGVIVQVDGYDIIIDKCKDEGRLPGTQVGRQIRELEHAG